MELTPEGYATARGLLDPVRSALYNTAYPGSSGSVERALAEVFVPDAEIHLCHPFEDLDGANGWYQAALGPLANAMADLERRDYIVMCGPDLEGELWIGCAGDYMGTFARPFMDIPPTGRPASFRYHEFFRIVDGRVVELQALWDLPELMMQAGVWPMGPGLGRFWRAPSPATQDGLMTGARNPEQSHDSREHVVEMLVDMARHPAGPVEDMRLDHWWHPMFGWYGPAGIGTSRGVDGFRRFHQIPFLAAMPDRRGGYARDSHFFGDGLYVGETGWPAMAMTVTGSGFLGIVPTGAEITMRSLDFWRLERSPGGLKIRENWVLIDLLNVWHQLGVDVLARMRELSQLAD